MYRDVSVLENLDAPKLCYEVLSHHIAIWCVLVIGLVAQGSRPIEADLGAGALRALRLCVRLLCWTEGEPRCIWFHLVYFNESFYPVMSPSSVITPRVLSLWSTNWFDCRIDVVDVSRGIIYRWDLSFLLIFPAYICNLCPVANLLCSSLSPFLYFLLPSLLSHLLSCFFRRIYDLTHLTIFLWHRGFFMGPSARSAYPCTTPAWKTERRRREVCKEDAVQRYPDFARGGLKNSISFSVEVDSAKLPTPTMVDRLLMHSVSNVLCHMWFCFQITHPYLAPQTSARTTKILFLLICVHYEIVFFASQQSAR